MRLNYYQQLARTKLDVLVETPEISAARRSIAHFARYLFGLVAFAHHQAWLNAIQTDADNETLKKVAGDNLRISAPRGAGKTTWFCLIVAWVIGHNPNIRIMITSYSDEIALSLSVYVKAIIENPKYRDVFPGVAKSSRWRDRAWTVARTQVLKDPTVLSVGMSGGIASRRADFIFIDDPIKSSADILNPAMREQMVSWWYEVMAPCLVPGGRVVVLSTRYRIDDIHGTTFNETNGFQVISQPAILPGRLSYWPERYTIEFLEEIQQRNPRAFASQYLNDPQSEGERLITTDLIVYKRVPQGLENIVVGVDLAASFKETADYTAMVAIALKENKFYVLRSFSGRIGQHETISLIYQWQDDFSLIAPGLVFVIEAVAYQVAFVTELKRRSLMDQRYLTVDKIQPKGDKYARFFGITGLFESRSIFFDVSSSHANLVHQLVDFGYAAHDDLADAFVYAAAKLSRSKRLESVGI